MSPTSVCMSSVFDTVIPRRGTGNIKYDRRPDLDPFWVADMDFASCPEIIEALHRRVDHGVFGYAQAHDGLNEAVIDYLATHHGGPQPLDHIVHLGGLVPALSLAVRAFCKPGEAAMTCTPVYPPFLGVHRDADAKLITVDHVLGSDGLHTFDWEAMAAAVTPETKLFILCNPQNPVGRVFSEAEVRQLAEFCRDHDLILVSDEIHCDLILEPGVRHFSALRLPDDLRQHTITLLSPSKTWNIAGLGYAYAVVPDDSVRRRFVAARGHTLAEINALSYYAAEAAYRHGEPWRQELITYLRGNRDTLIDFIGERIPALKPVRGQATYLAWIDARATRHDNPALHLEKEAGLFVSDGAFFHWPGWIRFNFACPRSRMLEGLEKMAAAF